LSGSFFAPIMPNLRTKFLTVPHDAAVGTDPPAVKGGGNLLAVDDWKAERQKVRSWRAWRASIPAKAWLQQPNLRQIKS